VDNTNNIDDFDLEPRNVDIEVADQRVQEEEVVKEGGEEEEEENIYES
jgi:hypothetical protein